MQKHIYPVYILCFLLASAFTTKAQVADWNYEANLQGTRICFSTAQDGIVCSLSSPRYTSDGGQTWNYLSGMPGLVAGAAPSVNHIILISLTNIYVTFTGGSFVNNGSSGGHYFNDVFFLDDNHGWVAGNDGNVNITVNGGSNWNDVLIGAIGNGINCTAISFVSSSKGCVGTSDGKIYTTSNGGSNWTAASMPGALSSDYTVSSIKYISDLVAVATCASTSHQDGIIIRSTDGGASWGVVHTNTSEEITQVAFKDATTGYAVGLLFAPRYVPSSGLIYKTTDAGQTWTQLVFQDASGCDFYGITFFDSDHGWIIGGGCLFDLATSTAVSDVSAEKTVKLYPNPVNNLLHVTTGFTTGEKVSYEVTDVSGKTLVSEVALSNEYDVDISGLVNGMYLIKMKQGNNSMVSKFVKE